MDEDTEIRVRALVLILDCDAEEVEHVYSGPYGFGETFSVDGGDYAVMSEYEADQAWDEALQSYLDECVYPQLPDGMVGYFDEEAWKQDARMDGRGHCLSPYDGVEHEVSIGNEYWYVYRV